MGALGVGKNSRGMRAGGFIGAFCAVGLVATPVAAAGVFAPEPIMIAGIPVDFILFALTLLGVALFHHHTLQVALTGLAAITLYKLGFTGFKYGTGLPGLVEHMSHEAVILSNLFLLLMGFALLSRHFEKSKVPDEMPRFLPDDWKGGFLLLVIVAVISSFLDNIAAALIGGTMAQQVFRGKIHIGYLAAIVAASNAGGSGSVVGDTTTTMMWIDGVSPLSVLEAFVAASVALVVCGIPAAIQQQRYSPILKDAPAGVRIEWARVFIVALILVAAIVSNVVANVRYPELLDTLPVIGLAVWAAILVAVPLRQPDWGVLPETFKGTIFLLALVTCASMMPVEKLPARFMADGAGPWLRLGRVRQHPAHGARVEAGRLRLGLPRLRRRLRRLDDLVRLVCRRGARQHVPGGEIGRALADRRLARDGRLRRGLLRHAGRARLAPRSAAQEARRAADAAGRCRGPASAPEPDRFRLNHLPSNPT